MTDEEARVLAWTILGEASGEGRKGMEAVAHVIRNRSTSGRYPSNPAAVALQHNSRGIYQFSAWNALSQGGNIPRSRFPVGSSAFERAMGVVRKVFGPTPGADPTRGATHYYSHAMMGEPYWWRSEAPNGGLKIGNHTFAYKYEPKQAPTPAGPRPAELLASTHFNRLPPLAPPGRRAPTPATPSLRLQQQREDEGATVRSITTYVYDPIRKTLVPKGAQRRYTTPEIADIFVRDNNEPGGPALGGVSGSVAEEWAAGFTWAGNDRGTAYVPPKPAKGSASDRTRAYQRQFMVPGPDGTIVPKDQSRLPAGVLPPALYGPMRTAPVPMPFDMRPRPSAPIPATQSAALAAQRARLAPVPRPRLVREPPATALKIEVSGANAITVPEVILGTNGYVYQGGKQIGTVRPEGMSPQEQYDFVNAASRERARANATSPIYRSTNSAFNRWTGRT